MNIVEYVPDPAEPPQVHALREEQAAELREWIKLHVSDDNVGDVDFAYTLHAFTYEQAKTLCRLALKLHEEADA